MLSSRWKMRLKKFCLSLKNLLSVSMNPCWDYIPINHFDMDRMEINYSTRLQCNQMNQPKNQPRPQWGNHRNLLFESIHLLLDSIPKNHCKTDLHKNLLRFLRILCSQWKNRLHYILHFHQNSLFASTHLEKKYFLR